MPNPLSSVLPVYLIDESAVKYSAPFGDDVNVMFVFPLIGAIDQLLSAEGLIFLTVEI